MPRKKARPRPAAKRVLRVREGSAELRWLTRVLLDAIHDAQLREHGGRPGVRDPELLDSALNRPSNKYASGETDLGVLGAAYAFGVVKNHGYLDGNKRLAFQALYVFLGLNGHDLEVSEPEVVDVMIRLASGKMTEATFAVWVRKHTSAPTG